MKRRLLAAVIAATLTLSLGATAFAETNETDQLRQEITKLNARLAQLEAKQNATAAKVNAPTPKPNVTFFFDNRIQWNHTNLRPADGGSVGGEKAGIADQGQFMERIRVYMNAKVGDTWEWNARLHQTKWNINGPDNTVKFDRFWVTDKNILGGTLDLGRQGLFPGKALFWNYVGDTDAAVYTAKADRTTFKIGAGYQGGSGNSSGVTSSLPYTLETKGQLMKFAEVSYKPTKKSDIGLLYIEQNNPNSKMTVAGYPINYRNFNDLKIFAVNGAFEIPNTDGLALAFEWGKNHASNNAALGFKGGQNGYYIALHSSYSGTNIHPMLATSIVNPFKKGDHGWALSYRHMPTGMAGLGNRATASMVPATTDTDGSWMNNYDNVNAWRFDYIYVPWKNVQWTLTYDRIKPITGSWTNNNIQSTFNFFF